MEIPWHHRRPAPHSLLFVAIVFAMLTEIAFYTVDEPVARVLSTYEPWPWWTQVLEALEWGLLLPLHKLAFPAFLVLGMLVTLIVGPWRVHAPEWMFLAAVYIACLATTNPLKEVFGRVRPTQWLERGGGSFWWEDGIAFPSGHVALFAGAVIPICVLLPRGMKFAALVLVAVLMFVGAARIGVNAHFVSDTTAAITLAALWAWLVGLAVRPLP